MLYREIERNLDVAQFELSRDRLFELSERDSLARTRAYLIAARCYFGARNAEESQAMIDFAQQEATESGIEAQVRVALIEASLHTAAARLQESSEKLVFAFEHLSEVSAEVRGLAWSIRGRNEGLGGAYAEAIEFSQEAIALAPHDSSASSFANGTLAYVFQVMGRIVESEQFMLEQIRILTLRGSENGLAGLYAFLCEGASSQQDWKKALEYQSKAMEFVGRTPSGSSTRPALLFWMADSQLGLGNPDAALEYAQEGLAIAEEMSNAVLTMNAQILLGRIRYKHQDYDSALSILHVPLQSENQLGDFQRINLYQALAQTYQALDRKAEAFDICWRLWELQTDFDNRTREALLNYHRSLEQKIHAQKTAILNLKATQMERELALTASQLAAQTDLLGRFRNDLREIVRDQEEPASVLKRVKEKLKTLPCEQIDWGKFEAQFASVHPEFKAALEEKHPDLTRSEVKICSLSRLKLTSEEIAQLICLSARSVETHRFNIRKKLGLKKEQNLATYLAAL